MTRPGDRLRAIAARACGADTMTRLIDPVVADLQAEYLEAVQQGRVWRSRGVRIAGYLAFLKVLAFAACEGSMTRLCDGTLDDRQILRRTIGFSLSAVVVMTFVIALLALPAAGGSMQSALANPWSFLVRLVLSALPRALPVAVLMGMLRGVAGQTVSHRARGALILLALACSVASFATLAWIIPAASPVRSAGIVAQEQSPGDLPLGELRQRIDAYLGTPMAGSSLVRDLKSAYHRRWAMSGATLVFALAALAAGPRRRVRRVSPLWLVVVICFAYLQLLNLARITGMSGALSPFVAAWLPNVVFALGSAALTGVASRRAERLDDIRNAPTR